MQAGENNCDLKKVAVVYRSKSGFTQKYAEWIANAAEADLLVGNKTKAKDLMKYETIVLGGGLYAGGINGLKLITNNYSTLKHKKLVVFCLGATPVTGKIIDEVRNNNLSTEHQQTIKFFMLRGGFDYNKLTPINKMLMSLLKMKLKRKKELTADERGMLQSYSNPLDFTNEKSIEPILEFIK